jgi:hypothetical protein
MAMQLGPGFKAWPDTSGVELSTERVVEMYHEGFSGAFQDPEASAELNEIIVADGGMVDGNAVASQYNFMEAGAGKLTLLFTSVVQNYTYRALTKPGQKTGDCVSMAGRDVCLYLVCLEADSGLPDEKTGKVEGVPKVSDLARDNGVFGNEGIYKNRGHNGQGMSCSQGVAWVKTKGGIFVRQKFEQADLESYNVNFETSGRSGSPAWLDDVANDHQIRDVTRPEGEEAARDFLDRGKPIWTCSGLGWSSSRDENGYSRQQGSWSHSWHVVGYDDRDVIKKKYGFPLALLGHRWAIWNSGGREVYQSADLVPAELKAKWQSLGMLAASGNILIPEGYWWADARLLRKADLYALSGAGGWETSTNPDYLGGLQ